MLEDLGRHSTRRSKAWAAWTCNSPLLVLRRLRVGGFRMEACGCVEAHTMHAHIGR